MEDTTETPAASLQDSPAAKPSVVQYFDFRQHEAAQKLHKAGVWTDLGSRFGGLEIRLRPFHVHAVVVKRETAERAIRIQKGLREDEDIPAELSIEVNRAAVTMAITGARGRVLGSPAMNQAALAAGIRTERLPDSEDVLISFSGSEESEHVRAVLSSMLVESMPFLTTLIRASQALQKVDDRELVALGEDFVFGRHVKVDWRD